MRKLLKNNGHQILLSLSLEYENLTYFLQDFKKKVEIQPYFRRKIAIIHLQCWMVLEATKETLEEYQASDVDIFILGVLKIKLLLKVCPKKI